MYVRSDARRAEHAAAEDDRRTHGGRTHAMHAREHGGVFWAVGSSEWRVGGAAYV